MKNQRLINALEKTGIKININKHGNDLFWAENNGHIVEWYVQDDRAVCVCCRRINDNHDSQSDYHAGFFTHTIKRAVEYLNKEGAL